MPGERPALDAQPLMLGPHSILLDAQALSELAAGGQAMQAWATFARRTDSTLHTSTVTLAEVADGTARDAGVRRVTKAVRLERVTPDIGYRAGALRAAATSARRKPRDMTVDAVVAATAGTLVGPVVVLTSDQGDLALLLGAGPVRVERI